MNCLSKETLSYINGWYWKITTSGTSNQRKAWTEIWQANMSLPETLRQLMRLCRYYEELEAEGVTIA